MNLTLRPDVLHYTERTQGKFRDLRSVEVKSRKKFTRISLNGQYRINWPYEKYAHSNNSGKQLYFGPFHFVKYYKHCWHFSIEVLNRGITFSYGRNLW